MAVVRKRNAIVLKKLADELPTELTAMVEELCDDNAIGKGDTHKTVTWNRRFSASGKNFCAGAPRVRLS